jgi:RNA polymerase sigma-70 factor (ECF subfamily)
VDQREQLARRFEAERSRLRAVAYRMLGSLSEAEDAVQEAWLRLERSESAAVENLSGWLTTVVGRVCLDMLRVRKRRQEEPLELHLPDPVVTDVHDPEADAVLADSVSLALLVVLDALTPPERMAFVLHDMFAVPFAEIAQIVGRSPEATKMLASRARRRVQEAGPVPDGDMRQQRRGVDAFLAAARDGDFEALLSVLDPDVVLRAEAGGPLTVTIGAAAVASRAMMFAKLAAAARPVLVNGAPGVLARAADGRPMSIMAFTVVAGRIVRIDSIADPARLERLELPTQR